ncbi:hypothetical protein [Salimicrobium flavidum]|uniref:Uncharacterized protein n=1 Tax=Salimicrobium flavidum TaxID=570947 RepID=A0A1N7J986_9BACI|nr:hypothetical protein [Salimicrobium flavidum]SIS45827.1 hypothetical protein SAMN05421687_104178 [Salimicrobium flavidum]
MRRVAWTIIFLVILNISLFVLYGTMISSQEEPEMIRSEQIVDTENSAPSFES